MYNSAMGYLGRTRGTKTLEEYHQTFSNLVLKRKFREAVLLVCERDKGGVFQPEKLAEDCTGTINKTITSVLEGKHPSENILSYATLEMYEETPIFIPVKITEEAVESVAQMFLVISGSGGTDSEALQVWLLKFGEDSTRLRNRVENFVDWLVNGSPPWADYFTFMSGLMFALDKQTGVLTVGVGETWRRLFAKTVIKVTVPESTMLCQDDQLCAGLKAGIDGAIHGVQALWDKNLSTEEWDFLFVDANNAFNKINRVGMLWTVRYLWPYEARFVFNCYCYWSSLFL